MNGRQTKYDSCSCRNRGFVPSVLGLNGCFSREDSTNVGLFSSAFCMALRAWKMSSSTSLFWKSWSSHTHFQCTHFTKREREGEEEKKKAEPCSSYSDLPKWKRSAVALDQ